MKSLLTVLVVLATGWSVCKAQESPSDEQAAVEKAIASYVEAFNKADAKGLAALWNEQGQYTMSDGTTVRGRAELESEFTAYFAETKSAKLELIDTNVEVLSPSVAVETGTARVIVPEGETSETNYKAIHVKTTEGWRIDSVRDQEVAAPPPSHYEQLKPLEWMVGQWADKSENAQIETSCRWATNQNFLVRTFRVFVDGQVDFEGTDVIGWDPHRQAIRSWLFDSDGGFGAGRWSGGEDGRWTVQSLHVLPDGRRASATNIYEVVDENTVRFRSIGRQVDGELLPSIAPVEVVRVTASETK